MALDPKLPLLEDLSGPICSQPPGSGRFWRTALTAVILLVAGVAAWRDAQAVYYNLGAYWREQGVLALGDIHQKLLPVPPLVRRGIALGSASALSSDGSTLLVGAPSDIYDASDSPGSSLIGAGAAYVYVKSGGTWSQQAKLVATGTNNRQASDDFGISVAIDGDTALVGADQQGYDASGASGLYHAGAAYVFVRSGASWSQQAKLVPTGTNNRQSGDSFGSSVALSGDTALIAASKQTYDASGATSLTNAGAAYVFTRSGTSWTQQQKLVATGTNERKIGDIFGYSVALSGDTALIGAYGQDYDASGATSVDAAGAAYVFVRSGTSWSWQAKLVPSGTNNRMANDNFGESVALSGDTALIGASGQDYDDSGANSVNVAGAAYVFTRSGTSWSQQQKLVASGTNDRKVSDVFGRRVALSGDTALIGAPGQDYDASGASFADGPGAAYVFTRSGTSWSQQQKLVATGTNNRMASDSFGGGGVALSGDTALIGAYQQSYDASGANSVGSAGAAYVLTRSSGTWSQEQKLVGPDQPLSIGSFLGNSIALSEDGKTLLVGAYKEDSNKGAAYVFVRSSPAWSFQARLVPTGANNRMDNDYFGYRVALSGDTALIGAYQQGYDDSGASLVSGAGAAYVFTRSGTAWSQQAKLVATGSNNRMANDSFGYSVALSGETALIGAYQQDYDDSGASSVDAAGAAYVFTRSGTSWSQQQKLVATGTNNRISYDYFGSSVALSGDTALIGAYQQSYDDSGASLTNRAGAAYVFTRSGTAWSQQQKLVATGSNNRMANDSFGYSVALSGDTALIGAYQQSYDGSGASLANRAGAAYVFTRSGTAWSQQQKLVATGTNSRQSYNYFGYGVALSGSGDTALIGAYGHSYDALGVSQSSSAGAAYVFTRSGTGWSQQQKLVATGTNNRQSGDNFGSSVALAKNIAAIGAPYQDYDASGSLSQTDQGAAFVTGALSTSAVASQSMISGTSPVAVNGNSTVSVKLRDYMGRPVAGVVPQCSATGSGNTCNGCGTTDAQGTTTCTLTSTAAGSKTLWITSPVSRKGSSVTFN